MKEQITIEASEDSSDEFTSFIGTLLPGINLRDLSEMEVALLSGSPILGPYVVQGMREHSPVDMDSLRVNLPDNRPTGPNVLHCPWDVILQGISLPIAIACASGASKAFIDLLKTWVEERKGHTIRIRRGNCEIELTGGVTDNDVQRAVDLFEDRFGKSRIIVP